MQHRGVAAAVAVLAFGLFGAGLGAPTLTPAAHAAAGHGIIGPGVQMVTNGVPCVAGFVFRDRHGRTFVGYAAHCAGRRGAAQMNGCQVGSWPNGTRVRFARGRTSTSVGRTVGYGRLYWSSWRAMRRNGVDAPSLCLHNDFALVQVDPAYLGQVSPTVPFWGGPEGLAGPPREGGRVYTYTRAGSRGSPAEPVGLTPKSGLVTYRYYWGATVLTPNPGIAADVGGGFLDNAGRAAATLSKVGTSGHPPRSTVGALAAEVRFANHNGLIGLRLVRGRERFHTSAVF